MAAPMKKAQRDVCYKAKDKYMDCLKANANNMQLCGKQGEEFEDSCPQKWVEYFMKRHEFNEFRANQDKLGYIRKTEKS